MRCDQDSNPLQMYVLKRNGSRGNNGYVARPGSGKSYTNKEKAQRFLTIEQAKGNACGNEYPVKINDCT